MRADLGRRKEGCSSGRGPSAPFAQLQWPEVLRVRNAGRGSSAVGLFPGRTRLCGNSTRPKRWRLALPPLFLVFENFGSRDLLPKSLGRICFIFPKFRKGVFKSLNVFVYLFIYF